MTPVAIDAAIDLALALIAQANQIGTAITAAKAAGQTTLSADQWSTIIASDNTARAALVSALAAK
jgi:hypothetical protein